MVGPALMPVPIKGNHPMSRNQKINRDAPAPRTTTKSELVLSLLRRGEGATLAELIEATGWLPHTTRAALTGVRKKGHAIEKSKRGEETCYRIIEAA